MTRNTLLVVLIAAASCTGWEAAAQAQNGLKLLEVQKVWDVAPHNAFTSLVRFRGRWFLTFREGPFHGVPKPGQMPGRVRVLCSDDARQWRSVALLDYGPDQDVRDPKLSITADGQLLLNAAAAPHAQSNTRQSLAWLSPDGVVWTGPVRIGEPDWWLWRVSWGPDGKAYGVGYGPISRRPFTTRLYRSDDGIHFSTLIETFTPQLGTGEVTVRFLRDGTGVALVRREGKNPRALVGTARPDYTHWEFRELAVRVGGPDFIQLPDGRLVAGGRFYGGKVRTALGWLDPKAGTLSEALALPSGGDTSYPGFVWHDGRLWVSYYSSHEGKTSIYLAQVQVSAR